MASESKASDHMYAAGGDRRLAKELGNLVELSNTRTRFMRQAGRRITL